MKGAEDNLQTVDNCTQGSFKTSTGKYDAGISKGT